MQFDKKKIQEILAFMRKEGICHFHWKDKDKEVTLTLEGREKASLPIQHPLPAHAPPKEDAKYITSPLVGTFYRKPSPSSEEYVKLNQRVDEEMVVCIIEAMKVMNEVKAEFAGRIVEVLMEDGVIK